MSLGRDRHCYSTVFQQGRTSAERLPDFINDTEVLPRQSIETLESGSRIRWRSYSLSLDIYRNISILIIRAKLSEDSFYTSVKDR